VLVGLLACAPKARAAPPAVSARAGGAGQAAPAPKDSTAKAEPEAPKWDVNDPPGEETDVKIDVREGTWMAST
jgi:hypothetical protein